VCVCSAKAQELYDRGETSTCTLYWATHRQKDTIQLLRNNKTVHYSTVQTLVHIGFKLVTPDPEPESDYKIRVQKQGN